MPSLKSLQHFCKALLDPRFEIYQVLRNTNNPQYFDLQEDFKMITREELSAFQNKHQRFSPKNNQSYSEETIKTEFLIDKLQYQINEKHLEFLLKDTQQLLFFNSSNINETVETNDGLIKSNLFDVKFFNLRYRKKIYMLCPINECSNSSYWLSQALTKIITKNKLTFKIRLDPFKEFEIQDYTPLMYKMHVHGKPLNWENLKSLKEIEFGQWFNEIPYEKAGFTDYIWSPKKDNTLHFTCEEVPKANYDGKLTSRYFHAIFNKYTGKINHCDGAIRYYTPDEFYKRINCQVKDPDARRVGKRMKIFQFDSIDNEGREMNQSDFCDLIINFFVWNKDILGYFN